MNDMNPNSSASSLTRKTLLLIACLSVWGFVAPLAIAWKYTELAVRQSLAAEQVGLFTEMALADDEAFRATLGERTQYVAGYYPTGTKQVPGTQLDRIVEKCRRLALAHLGLRAENAETAVSK